MAIKATKATKDDTIIGDHMRKLAKLRWAKKTPKQRAEEQRAKILRRLSGRDKVKF